MRVNGEDVGMTGMLSDFSRLIYLVDVKAEGKCK